MCLLYCHIKLYSCYLFLSNSEMSFRQDVFRQGVLVPILELVRIQLGFSSSDIINYLHYLSVTI